MLTKTTSLLFSVSQRTDILEHPDLIVLKVRIGNSKIILINIYNGADNSALRALLTIELPPLPTIITGDFNLHHPNWSLPETNESAYAEQFLDWGERQSLVLLNEPEEVMFERGSDQSVLDLTWTNQLALPLIRDWTIHANLDFASDHLPITWSMTGK